MFHSVAQSRPGADAASLTFTCASTEAFELRGPYSLIIAAESLHWMEWAVIFPKITASLVRGGQLALVEGRHFFGLPWDQALLQLIPKYSTNLDFEPYDLLTELEDRGLFEEKGRCVTRTRSFSQSLDDYVESFHTRNGFSRDRMRPERADAFDDAVRALAKPHCPDDIVRGQTQAELIFGNPKAG